MTSVQEQYNLADMQLTVSEVANFLKISQQAVRKLIKEQKIKAHMEGTQPLVSKQQLDEYIQKYDVCIEPDDHMRKEGELPDILALSFFSGAMGLDIGMNQGGIKAALACEKDKFCRMTINKNAPEMALIGDINQYTAEDILNMAKIPAGRKIDVIFGGPPCQAFSTAGARRALDDARGNVFLRYLDIISELKPTYVVIENVRGLLSAPYPYGEIQDAIKGGALCVIMDRLRSMGYSISFELYNAANFGVPQIRERIVIIGKLGESKVSHLFPTNAENGEHNLPMWRTLKEAIGDLDEAEQHFINFPEKRLKFYRMLKAGQYWKDLPAEAQVEAMGNKLKLGGGKTGFYRRLDWGRPSPTLVTDPTMPATDLCHPEQDRPLSVEEYARIQGFPDTWQICGPIKEQYRQIGNAVPILLGKAIAKTIIADMQGARQISINNFRYSRYRNTDESSWQKNMDRAIAQAQYDNQLNKPHQLSFIFNDEY